MSGNPFINFRRGLTLSVLVLSYLTVRADVFSSNLPLVSITTTEQINADEKVNATMKVIMPGADGRCHVTDTVYNYYGNIGIKWRGNSSLSFEQKKYTIETRDSLGEDLKVSIMDLPKESDWALLAPYNDISLLRDVFAFNLWNEMGHWGPRTRMCEVFVNDEYMGVYAFSEVIKRDKNRVDIAKLKEDDIEGRALTGGYIVRIDAFDETDATFTSKVKGIQPGMWGGTGTGTVTWTVCYPKKENLKEEQMSYIKSFVDDMELSFQSEYFASLESGYSKWIDVSSFVDYFIHTELSMNADGFKRSSYFYRDKDKSDGTRAKMQAGPVWDYNLAYGNCNFCNANNPRAWVYEGCNTNPTPVFWSKLVSDKAFMAAVESRYAQLRKSVLSQSRINEFFDGYAVMLDEAKDRHFNKYSNLLSSGGNSGWGWGWGWNQNPVAAFAAYTVSSYDEEMEILKGWFEQRLSFLDEQWHYNHSAVISIEDGYFSASFFRTSENCVRIISDRPLFLVEVFDVSGRLTDKYIPALAQELEIALSDDNQIKVICCHAVDGSFISYRIK